MKRHDNPQTKAKDMRQTPLRKVSKKMVKQQGIENVLKKKLGEKYGRCCHHCGSNELPRDKHEIVFRSQGGDPLDEDNCLLLARFCHDCAHGRAKGSFLSAKTLQKIVENRAAEHEH